MEIILTVLATALVCVSCFIIGAKVGQKVSKGEDIELPHPVKTWQENHAKREAEKAAQREQDKLNAILQNIDRYDGTPANQQDVPRG